MRILARLAAALIIGGLGAIQPAHAADIEGSSDHPLVGRYEGSEIVGYEVTEYDEVNLVEGPFSPLNTTDGTGFRTVEGKITLIYYTLPKGRSTLEVLRNYEQSLKARFLRRLYVRHIERFVLRVRAARGRISSRRSRRRSAEDRRALA